MKRFFIVPELITALLIAGLFMNALWEGIALYIGYSGFAVRICFDTALFLTIAFYYMIFENRHSMDKLLLISLAICSAAGFALDFTPGTRLAYTAAAAMIFTAGVIRDRCARSEEKADAADNEAYYKSIEERYLRSRELWHDMRGHIAVLNSYINRGDYEGMKEYTAEFCDDLERTVIPFRTGNMAADIVLGDKVYLAKKHRIDVRLSIAPLDRLTVKNPDLCVVLANLMDNAIDACLKIDEEERYINIKAVWNGESCFLSVENPCRCGDTSHSSKPNSEQHGIGLRSVERVVHSCGGMFVTAPKGNAFKAVAELR